MVSQLPNPRQLSVLDVNLRISTTITTMTVAPILPSDTCSRTSCSTSGGRANFRKDSHFDVGNAVGDAVGYAVGGLLVGSPFHIFDHAAAGKDRFVLGLRSKGYAFILIHGTDPCQRDIDRHKSRFSAAICNNLSSIVPNAGRYEPS